MADCSQSCDTGILDDTCSYCICDNNNVWGQVMSNTFLPLANVTFSPTNSPNIINAISNVGGYFNLSGFCHEDVYVLRKSGYVDTDIRLVDGTSNITMDTVGENYLILLLFYKQPNIKCFIYVKCILV